MINTNGKILVQDEMDILIAFMLLKGEVKAYFDLVEQKVKFLSAELVAKSSELVLNMTELSFNQTAAYCYWNDNVIEQARARFQNFQVKE